MVGEMMLAVVAWSEEVGDSFLRQLVQRGRKVWSPASSFMVLVEEESCNEEDARYKESYRADEYRN
jgi:hypothetical protein